MDLFIYYEQDNVKELYENHSTFYDGDSGIDLFFAKDQIIPYGETTLVDLSISCEMKKYNNNFHIKGTTNQLFVNQSYWLMPRSSIYKTPLRMANSIGLIDSMYRGNLMVPLDNFSDKDYIIKRGDRLFQIASPNLDSLNLIVAEKKDIDENGGARGARGFGSSGK